MRRILLPHCMLKRRTSEMTERRLGDLSTSKLDISLQVDIDGAKFLEISKRISPETFECLEMDCRPSNQLSILKGCLAISKRNLPETFVALEMDCQYPRRPRRRKRAGNFKKNFSRNS